jgi:virulence-associated protein VapD
MSDLISKKTRIEFREYFVGTSLRHISQEFDAADVPCDADFQPRESGQRRSLVEQY